MAIYTVHEPPLKRYETAPAPERFRFVRDGFSFWAFLFGPLWMLRHRMWLVLVGYAVTVAVVALPLYAVRAPPSGRAGAAFLIALLVGIEAGTLRRFTLGRRRFNQVGLVAADDLEDAERRFFDGWVRRDGHSPVAPASAVVVPPTRVATAAPEVIGLFPEPGAQR
jgi:hypothetical protein